MRWAKIDPRTGRVLHDTGGLGGARPSGFSRPPSGSVAVDHGPRGIAVHDGRIDVGGNPSGLAAGLGGVWVSFG
jgi:hypothetical protein